ncbi:uncharacterized protein LOC110720514 [Chenopodium quinoa]|uniref:uncharacterized protein LOC110720514 n=1 Tax=Chenopodium quinoa TaxID=63459 RepID=UPI000B7703FA|nr:uncharacterized protein LOC110720514 [Chenopodium quinoa]
MGPEVDMSGKLDTPMKVSPVSMKDNSTVKLSEENLVVCTSNCEDHGFADADAVVKTPEENPVTTCASSYEDSGFHMDVSRADCDQGMAANGNDEDLEVDIVENVESDEEVVSERESLDATENSSSFGCTDSETGTAGALNDVEVESELRNDNSSLMEFDGFNDLFKTRKKKLTAQWRKFVRPLMWRCKWVELQIRELRSQASKYDRELAECAKTKQCELEKYAAEDLAVKTAPSVCQNRPVRVMKRKKRKRVEETTDLTAYSSCHSLFSYFVNKRRSGDSAYLDDDHGNTEKTTSGVSEFGINGEWSFLDKDSDSFENILRNIEVAQMHVRQLRSRIDKVVRENAEILSFDPGEALINCGPSSILAQVDGENFQIGSYPTTTRQTLENKMIMPESVVSGPREVNPANMIGTADQQQFGRICGKVKEESNHTEVVGTRLTAELQSGTEVKSENIEHVLEPNSPSKMTASQEQLAVKVRSKLTTSKNKKKRGRRKARIGRWSRKSSG